MTEESDDFLADLNIGEGYKYKYRYYNPETQRRYYQNNKHVWVRFKEKHKERLKEYNRLNNLFHSKTYKLRAKLKKYNLTLDQYTELVVNSKDRCAICQEKEKIKNKSLALDHCHKTGKVRGLLCGRCNKALGAFNENIELFKKMIAYIEEHKL